MFFLNIRLYLVKTVFFTKMNLAVIQTFLPTLSDFEGVKNHIFSRVLDLSLLHPLFHKVELALISFYDIKRLQFDQVEIDSQLENLSFFFLLVTVIVYWIETAFHSKAENQKFASLMVKLSNLSLTFLLATRWITSHHFPLSNLYESLIFLSWSLTIIHLILEKTSNTLLIGVLLSPVTLFINGFALFTLPAEMQKGNFLTPALQSNWLMMHVTVMISSYAALLSGSILAIAFLIVTRNTNKNGNSKAIIDAEQKSPNLVLQSKMDPLFLQSEGKQLISDSEDLFFDKITKNNFDNLAFVEKNKQFLSDPKFFFQKTFFSETETRFSQNTTRLAKTLDNLSYRTIGIGFPLLTIGILSGAVWANEAWGSYWSWDPKETWALITWFLFAIYLHTRITKGLQGEKPAIIATIGFVVVWICFLGVNLASQGLHTYGWLQ